MTFSASRSSAAAVFGALMAFAVPAALSAAEVTGRVTDESEAPIAGARVTLHPEISPAERGALWLSGRQHPPPVGRAAGPRHQPVSPEVAVYGESASDLVLATEPVLTLTGHVESGDGSAIDGATIVAQPSVMTREDRSEDCGRAQALSGEGGRFRLPGLTPHCDYHLRAWREGYATTWLDIPPLADDAPGYEPVRLVLVTGRNLIGRVVDPDGVPVPGARIEFRRYAPWGLHFSLPVLETRERAGLADADGFFEIEHLSGGARGRIVVEADGFMPSERRGVEVSEELGETALGDLELAPERFLEIEVADVDGRPIEGAEVDVYRSDPDELFGGNDSVTDSDARTDAAGRFRIGGFAAGDQAMLLVSKEGFVSGSLQNVGVPHDSPVRVVLEEGSVVTGRVVDTSGRPVTEARVSTEESEWLGRYAGSRVDDEGRFELGRLPAGPLRLRALGPEGEGSDVLRLELEAGERVDGLELVLRSRPRILGRVLAPDGSPVSQPRVVVRGGGPRRYCDSGEDGGFRCEGREPGTYTLAVHEEGVGQAEGRVVLDDTDVTVDLYLEPELVISGRVVTAGGEPVAGRVVRVQPRGHGFFDSPSDDTGADGSFTIRGVSEGTYELLVGSSSDPMSFLSPHRHPEPIVVQDGFSVTDVEIRLKHTTVLRGGLYGLPDDQLARALVGAEEVGAEGFPRTLGGVVASGGRYEIPGIGPGTWTVVAVGPERDAQARREIEILPGEVDPVLDLTFVRGVTLAGRILLDGDPWSGAGVAMLTAVGTTSTDLGGRFELPGIPPGRQEILLAGGSPKEGMTVVTQECDVEEGREVLIDVATGVVRGVVTSLEMPLASASVALSPVIPSLPDSFPLIPRLATTASDGSFVIERVPVGAYTISFDQPGYAPVNRELHVTSGEVELSPVILEPETR